MKLYECLYLKKEGVIDTYLKKKIVVLIKI